MTLKPLDDNEANYADEPGPGWVDEVLTRESGTHQFLLFVLFTCCLAFPATGFLAGLGLLTCRTRKDRFTSVVLLIVALLQAIFLWFAVIGPLMF